MNGREPAHIASTADAAPAWPAWARWPLLVAVALAGLVVRVGAARGDLWLDEIWSAELARQVSGALDVFTRVHHDNNHYLATLWLRLAGDDPPLLARGLALLSGAAALAAMALAAAPRGWRVALAATALASGSAFLVHYQSEARGYAPAVLGALAAYQALDRFLATRRPGWALLAGGAAALGILSHLTFVLILAGALAWIGRVAWRRRALDPWLLAPLVPPIATLAWLWLVDLRFLVRGGGPEDTTWDVLRELWRSTFNLPPGAAEWLGLPLLALVGWRLVRLRREGDDRWAFFAGAFGAAAATVIVRGPGDYLAARYFAVCVPFLLLLVAEALGALAPAGRGGAVGLAGLLLLFAIAGVAPVGRLITDGRGRYREAIGYMLDHGTGSPITVGTDHEFRNGMVLGFHAERMRLGKPLVLLTGRAGGPPPEWYLRHEFQPAPQAAQGLLGPGDVPYRLAAVFPYAGLSGWTWLLYRRADLAGRSGR